MTHIGTHQHQTVAVIHTAGFSVSATFFYISCPPLLFAPLFCWPVLQALVSVSVIGTQDQMSDEQLTAEVLKEMAVWFGADKVSTWSHLRTYRLVMDTNGQQERHSVCLG